MNKSSLEKVKTMQTKHTERSDFSYSAERNPDSSRMHVRLTERAADQKLNAAAIKILSQRSIQARLLKQIVSEYARIPIPEIENQLIENGELLKIALYPDEQPTRISGKDTADSTEDEGTIYYDFINEVRLPSEYASEHVSKIEVNTEPQGKPNPGYPLVNRKIYYSDRRISSQYNRFFFHARYEMMMPVVSFWIVFSPSIGLRNSIEEISRVKSFLYGGGGSPPEKIPLERIYTLYLGPPEDSIPDRFSILKILDIIFSDTMSSEEKRKLLKDKFHLSISSEIEKGIQEMENLSGAFYQRGEEAGFLKGERSGFTKGERSGFIKGERSGFTKGELNVLAAAVQSLQKTTKMSIDQIFDSLQLSESRKQEIINLLKKQDQDPEDSI